MIYIKILLSQSQPFMLTNINTDSILMIKMDPVLVREMQHSSERLFLYFYKIGCFIKIVIL